MPYRVERVSSRRSLNDFIELPFRIYKNDPCWVPPLRSELKQVLSAVKNPYFANATIECFICYHDGEPVSRSAVIINQNHQIKFGIRSAFFGFFESIDDQAAAHHIFSEIELYCRALSVEYLEGPFNPNHYSEMGIQISQYGTLPSFFQTYNPPYYRRLLEIEGFQIQKTIFTAKNDQIRNYIRTHDPGDHDMTNRNGFIIRQFRMDDYRNELEKVREVFNDAFMDNWHFLPVGKEEYEFSTKFLRYVTSADLVRIVEYDHEPVGVLLCVQDINPLLKNLNGRISPLKFVRFILGRRKIRNLIVFAVGLKKRFQHTRAFTLLFDELRSMIGKYDTLETTWMSADNILAVKAAERFGMRPDKHFAIFAKRVS